MSAEQKDAHQNRRLGVDLGGTKVEVAVLDEAGEFLFRERLPTPQGDYAGTVETIASLIKQAEDRLGRVDSIGVGTPGTTSPGTGLMKNANSVVLNDKPLKYDLETRLNRSVSMANDANCLALSEATDGAAIGARSVFGVILGTGVGGALVFDGQLIMGKNAIAGEWGHNPLPWASESEFPGPVCWCGQKGCIEQWLSGPAFERDYEAATRLSSKDQLPTDQSLTGAEIMAKVATGDEAARAALDRYIFRLARALAHLINIFDPEVVVLGGGMSNVAALYEGVPAHWDEFVFSDPIKTKLVAPKFGDSSGVRGAAMLKS